MQVEAITSATQRAPLAADYLSRELWTIREACDFLRCRKSKLYEAFASGDLPRAKVGGTTFVPAAACRALVAAAVAAAEADAAARRVSR